jgi:hypothetical protein
VHNPYQPTSAALKEPPRPPRSPILAVIAGLAVDIGGSMLSSLLLSILYAVTLARAGLGPVAIGNAISQSEPGSGFGIAGIVVGTAFSFLGGYVCARIARRRERQLAAIQATLIVAFGLAMGGSRYAPWIHAAMAVATFAVVLLGAELGRRRNVAQARAAAAASAA